MGHSRHNHQVVIADAGVLSEPYKFSRIVEFDLFIANRRRDPTDRSGFAVYGLAHTYGEFLKPIEQLVPVSFTHYCASTPGLSTWWSSTALKGDLVLRGVSRLDAFSGYPVRT